MTKNCAATLFAVSLIGAFPLCSDAEKSGVETEAGCMLPSNLKEKGYRCDSVGDFGLNLTGREPHIRRSVTTATPDYFQPPKIPIDAYIDKQLTIRGVIIFNGKYAPSIVALKLGKRGEVIQLINYKETFPQNAIVEIKGKLRFAPRRSEQINDAATTPNGYYFDCQESEIRRVDNRLK